MKMKRIKLLTHRTLLVESFAFSSSGVRFQSRSYRWFSSGARLQVDIPLTSEDIHSISSHLFTSSYVSFLTNPTALTHVVAVHPDPGLTFPLFLIVLR
jgi:hypothetical protein